MSPTIAKPQTENHPLQPFLPPNAKLLLLGSFPPPQARWCMDFFYPNFQNDMWRIMGQVFFGDTLHFVEPSPKHKFRYEAIVDFCRTKGIAIYDTAQVVRRLQGNASDEHLEVVQPTDIAALLCQLPTCHDICCTGLKAAETLSMRLQCPIPKVGTYVETTFDLTYDASHTTHNPARQVRFWRMPSTSRAYPLSLNAKATLYQQMMEKVGML